MSTTSVPEAPEDRTELYKHLGDMLRALNTLHGEIEKFATQHNLQFGQPNYSPSTFVTFGINDEGEGQTIEEWEDRDYYDREWISSEIC